MDYGYNVKYCIVLNENRELQRRGFQPAGIVLCTRKHLRGRTSIKTELNKIIDKEGVHEVETNYDIVAVESDTGNVVGYAEWP